MEELIWEIKVPILKNRIIVKQLSIAIGIPFGILIFVFVVIKAYYGLILIGIMFFLAYLLIMLIFKGTYDVRYVINAKGILCENQPRQAKRVKALSFFTTLAGLLSRNATVAGAGILSGSRTKIFIPWKRIRKIKYIDKQKCMMLYGGFAENIAVFCTDDNFIEIKSILTEKLKTEKI